MTKWGGQLDSEAFHYIIDFNLKAADLLLEHGEVCKSSHDSHSLARG